MNQDERPLERSDYKRAYATLIALRSKAMFVDDDRSLWEMLRDIHFENLGYGLDEEAADGIISAASAEREIDHAMIVLEALIRGNNSIRKNAATHDPHSVCATPDCPNLTTEHYCMHCELGLSSE